MLEAAQQQRLPTRGERKGTDTSSSKVRAVQVKKKKKAQSGGGGEFTREERRVGVSGV